MKADKAHISRSIKIARGQLDGILRMIEEDRYCMDISQQLLAVDALVRRANKEVLTAHLKHCVEQADTPQERAQKVDELVAALGKLL